MLHGHGQNATSLRSVAERFAVQLPHTAFLLPGAPDANGGDWYQKDRDGMPVGIDRSATSIDAHVQALRRKLELDMSRIVFLGYSFGSSMATWMALHVIPETCCGVIMVNGNFSPALVVSDQGRLTPVVFCAGSLDTQIPIWKQREYVARLRDPPMSLQVEFKELDNCGHSIAHEELLAFVEGSLQRWLVQ